MNFALVQDIYSQIMRIPSRIRVVVAVGLAAILWVIWKTWNKVCFDNAFPYDPTSVIVQTAHFGVFVQATETRAMQNTSQMSKNTATDSS